MSSTGPSLEGAKPRREPRRPLPPLPEPPAEKETLVARLRKVNFARLNHVFIPAKKPDRDRLRKGRLAKLLGPLFGLAGSLTREGRSFMVLCLLLAAASVDVGESQVYLLFGTLVGVLCGALVLRMFYRLDGCRIEIENPSRVAVGEPLTFAVTIVNEATRDAWSVRVERPFLPWDGKWLGTQPAIRHVPAGARRTARAEARFIERGEHHLDAFDAVRVAPFGLTVGRHVESGGARFLVVPRIANVPRVTLSYRSPIRDGRSVAHTTPGDGEIAGVRPYRLGDPLKHLHVRTWARTGVPHVRHYVDERADRVALIVALDGTDAGEPRIEAAISLAAGIAMRLTSGEGSGLDQLVLGDRSTRVEPRRGRAALELCLDALAKLVVEKAPKNPLGPIEDVLPSLSSVVLVTCDHRPERKAIADAIAQGSVPCHWIEVVDDGATGAAPRTVEVGPIERLEAVPC